MTTRITAPIDTEMPPDPFGPDESVHHFFPPENRRKTPIIAYCGAEVTDGGLKLDPNNIPVGLVCETCLRIAKERARRDGLIP